MQLRDLVITATICVCYITHKDSTNSGTFPWQQWHHARVYNQWVCN